MDGRSAGQGVAMNVAELIVELQKIENPADKQVEVRNDAFYSPDGGEEWTSTMSVEKVEIWIEGVRQPDVVRLEDA